MIFESIESSIEAGTEKPEQAAENAKLSAFQNPIYEEPRDLLPKIRFTTDKAEAEAAAQADRSDPFHLPDTVFYVGDEAKGSGVSAEKDHPAEAFQNPVFEIDVTGFTHEGTGTISIESVQTRITSDEEHLSFAQEQLTIAMERGTGVLVAMHNVESAQAVLDADKKLLNELNGAQHDDTPKGDGAAKVSFGSVSHAKWELENAYESGNQIAIHNAKRHLAEEKAKEDAK